MADSPVRVLLVDDDEDSCVITKDLLREIPGSRYLLKWVDSYESGMKEIRSGANDVILLDYRLGARTGIELLQEAVAGGNRGPFIMLTGQGEHEIDQAALQSGAADFLVKGEITPDLLDRSIRYAIENNRILRELLELNKTLDQKVKERTAQLYQAQKLESLGALAGGLAHDFGNFLAVITLQVDLLSEKLRPANFQDERASVLGPILENLRTASDQANELVRDVLLFSRRQKTEFSWVDLNSSVGNLVKILMGSIGDHYSLSVEMDPDMPKVRADPSHLQQALMNLILNARDAMPAGGLIEVTGERAHLSEQGCRGRNGASPGNYVRLSVTDKGTGMDPETLSRIFEPFFTTKGPDKGTGLGLPVVYGIAREHGGWVEVRSKPGEGSTFQLYFPA